MQPICPTARSMKGSAKRGVLGLQTRWAEGPPIGRCHTKKPEDHVVSVLNRSVERIRNFMFIAHGCKDKLETLLLLLLR